MYMCVFLICMKNPASTSAQHLMSEFRKWELFYSLETSNLQIPFSWDRNTSLQLSSFPLLLVKGSYENHQVGKIWSENRAIGDLPDKKHRKCSTYLEERPFPRMLWTFSGKLTFLHSLSSVCFSVLSPVLLLPNLHSRHIELLRDSKFPHVCCSVSCGCSLPPSTSEFIPTYPQLSLWSNSHIYMWLLEKPKLWLDRPLLGK